MYFTDIVAIVSAVFSSYFLLFVAFGPTSPASQYNFAIQVAELASLAQLLPPCSPTCVIRRRTALRQSCVRFSCCSPIALIRFNCMLFLVCVRFSCCSPLVSASAATPRLRPFQLLADCVRFGCCSSIASSTAAPASHLQLPDCVCFGCCSPIASASTAAPRLHPLNACSLTCSGRFQPMPNVLERSPRSSRFSKLKYEGRASL